MVQIGFGGINAPPIVPPQDMPARRVQDQQSPRPVRETEESEDGGERRPATLIDSRERTEEIRARERAEEEAIQAAQDERRREDEEREPRPGDRVDMRI